MASLQRDRSPCRSGELVTQCEQQSSSSPERSPSDDETSSDITLNEVDEADQRLPLSSTVREAPLSHSAGLSSSAIFPFHLLAGCSSAERRTMCILSASLTSQEVKTALGVGLRGTSSRAAASIGDASGPRSRRFWPWTLNVPSSLPPSRETFTRDHALTPEIQHQARLTMPVAALPHNDGILETQGAEKSGPDGNRTPALAHRMKHDKSILALAVSSQYIFAGTQGGEILVRV